MRCDELRAVAAALGALEVESEEHLSGCEACFDWVERRDPLIEALREARPPEVRPSPKLAGEVVMAWRASALLPVPGRAMVGLACAAFAAGAAVVSIMVATAVPGSRLGEVIGSLGRGLGALLAPLSALGGFATGQLLDHPASLFGLAVVAAAAAWGWTRIDLGMAASTRETG
jgi:hypothetical protein